MKKTAFILAIAILAAQQKAAAQQAAPQQAESINSATPNPSTISDPNTPRLTTGQAGVGMPLAAHRMGLLTNPKVNAIQSVAYPSEAKGRNEETRDEAASTKFEGTSRTGHRSNEQTDTADCPRADLSNGTLHARFYLPDAQTAYYRGTRFDWSGVIASLDFKGHSLFGRWNGKYDPTLNDAILGPVESFTPVGYDEAAPGSPFLQVGVGILTRPDTNSYTPFKYFPIQNPGNWNISKADNAIAFRQDLDAAGYAYTYIKTITLKGAQLTITHTLKNTGKKPIESDVYNHNFFVIDTLDVAPGRVLKLPWIPVSTPADPKVFDSLAALSGDSIIIKQPFVPRKSFYTLITGYSDKAADYDLRLEEQRTKVGVRIRGDRPLVKLAYWASLKTACPEPFIHVKASPGETTTWTLTYDFYTLAP